MSEQGIDTTIDPIPNLCPILADFIHSGVLGKAKILIAVYGLLAEVFPGGNW